MSTLPDLFARLTELSIAWSVERNEHKLVYEPLAHYLNDAPWKYGEDELTPDDLRAALAADELYEVRAYPSTPVGFAAAAGPDLETALRRLVEMLEPGSAAPDSAETR